MYIPGVLCSILFLTYFHLASSLYEDQIGKFDWKINQLGKIKFSSIELRPPTKKVFVATEENVIAGLSTKTGEILWRQILEKDKEGTIQLMHVDVEMVTVTGCGPFTIRGWNTNLGSLLYEWSIPSARSPEVMWTLHQGKLYMLSIIGTGQVEVAVYNVRVGGQPVTYTLSCPPFPQKHNFVVAGLSLVYGDTTGEHLISISLTGNTPAVKLRLASPLVSLVAVPSVSDQTYVRLNNQLVIVAADKLTLLDAQLPPDSNVAVHSHTADQNILIVLQHAGKEVQVRAQILETGAAVPELSSKISHTFPLSRSDISSLVCLTRRDKTVTCQLLLNGLDNAMLLVQVPGNLMWLREEALTSIVNMELVDLPVSDGEVAIEEEFNIKEGGCVGMFMRRIASQLLQLQTFLLTVLRLRELPSNVNGRADLVRDDFGLHKMIVAVTSVGKVYGIDNLSHEIIWQFTLEGVVPFNKMEKAHVPLFVQRTARHYPYPAQCVVLYRDKVTEEAVLHAFNPINGKSQEGSVRLGYKVKQAVLLASVDEEFVKGLLLLDTRDRVHVFPASSQATAIQAAHNTYLYTADTATGDLTGYSLTYSSDNDLRAVPVWEIKLGQKITAIVGKSPLEKVHSQGRVLGDRSVLYKYINPNLVVVLTQIEDPLYKNVLSVYLVDVVSGSVVFSAVHKRTLEPIHVVHSENWVIYSYFSDKTRRTEVTTFDLYEGKTQSNTTAFSSVWNPIQPMVERQSYILPASVEMMKETITEKGITSKHILVALNNGGVLELPWVLLDPRRPLASTPDLREEAVIPYMPELPTLPEAIINYNQTLLRVSGIHTAPSGLESTCLVTVYGLDIFYTRVAPSKTFDMLKEDFDYILITAVLVGLTVSAFMTKRLAARKALKQAWK